MALKYRQPGNSLNHTPGAAVSAGDIVVIGSLLGVSALDIAAGYLGALQIGGVYEMPKEATTDVYAVGDHVFIDTSTTPPQAARLPTTNTKYFGICVAAAAATDETVLVRFIETSPVQYMVVAMADLAAGADIADQLMPGIPKASKVVSVHAGFRGAPAGVDDSNTVVILIKDNDGNTIVTKTYNTATQPPSGTDNLGAVSDTHGVLAALEAMKASVTQGATGNLAQLDLIFGYIPAR